MSLSTNRFGQIDLDQPGDEFIVTADRITKPAWHLQSIAIHHL